MRKFFKVINVLLILSLLLSSVAHIILLASDSQFYRILVLIQIAIQLLASVLIFGIQKFKLSALVCFIPLSIVFSVINSVYINYGMIEAHIFAFIIFWCIYGSVLYKVKSGFGAKYA
jgi:prepilin signal peptidase PulO-like enzyme (type II secretory pathway)